MSRRLGPWLIHMLYLILAVYMVDEFRPAFQSGLRADEFVYATLIHWHAVFLRFGFFTLFHVCFLRVKLYNPMIHSRISSDTASYLFLHIIKNAAYLSAMYLILSLFPLLIAGQTNLSVRTIAFFALQNFVFSCLGISGYYALDLSIRKENTSLFLCILINIFFIMLFGTIRFFLPKLSVISLLDDPGKFLALALCAQIGILFVLYLRLTKGLFLCEETFS